MINDSRGTLSRPPLPTASSSERDIVGSGESDGDIEKCVGGPRVAGPAVGTPKRRRKIRQWTYPERRAVIAAYESQGPDAAVEVGRSFGASKSATLSVLDLHRSTVGAPTWAQVQRAKLVELFAKIGKATTGELVRLSGLSAPTVRLTARQNGWIETKTRRKGHPGRCEQSWRLPS